tara:strand:- start:318 stop:791 length:474 start_codon:yes stop_codon:yes gene_type:complete
MAIYSDISTELETLGRGTVGTDIFNGPERPELSGTIPTDSIFVGIGATSTPPEGISGDVAAIMYIPIQIIVRNTELTTGQSLAQLIHRNIGEMNIPNSIGHTLDQGQAVFLGLDVQDRYRWSINLTVISLADDVVQIGDGALWFDDADNSAWIPVAL